MQTNWIGRSEGAEIVFDSAPAEHHAGGEEIRVFTTRPDTLFGATFMVLAPEHPLVATLTAPERRQEVEAYAARAAIATEIERLSTDREKTGVAIGADAINPVNGERIPIFVADYVLSGYGTGAIMAVPAHDERDFAFAVKFGLPIRQVVGRPGEDAAAELSEAYIAHADDEILVNSGEFNGLSADEGGRRIVASLEERGKGKAAVTYRLRDWLVSRQRYWGTPIPVIHCPTHGIVPVPEEDLPVLLPDTVDYAGVGVNPLTRDEAFLNVACPIDGEPAKRETDTMDTFMDSSWYWYRYLSPDRSDFPIDHDRVETWTPVQLYTGGAEHAVMHHLYGRMFTKMIRDLGLVRQNEPWRRVFNQGQILGADGERMRKSRGNVQDPDELVFEVRRGHRPAVPHVHGAVGPGRPMEPDGHGRRAPLPEPRVGPRPGPDLQGARRPRRGDAPGRPGRDRRARRTCARPPIGRCATVTADYEVLPLQHDGRQAHGADQHPVPLPRLRRRRWPRMGRGRPAAAADAGARSAAHHGRAVVASAGHARRAMVVDPHRRHGQPWISLPWRKQRARCRSRSTARSATGSPWRRMRMP